MNCLLVVNCLLTNDSDELSVHSFVLHIKMSQNMSSAAIMIATLRDNGRKSFSCSGQKLLWYTVNTENLNSV